MSMIFTYVGVVFTKKTLSLFTNFFCKKRKSMLKSFLPTSGLLPEADSERNEKTVPYVLRLQK